MIYDDITIDPQCDLDLEKRTSLLRATHLLIILNNCVKFDSIPFSSVRVMADIRYVMIMTTELQVWQFLSNGWDTNCDGLTFKLKVWHWIAHTNLIGARETRFCILNDLWRTVYFGGIQIQAKYNTA